MLSARDGDGMGWDGTMGIVSGQPPYDGSKTILPRFPAVGGSGGGGGGGDGGSGGSSGGASLEARLRP
ncbi:hypothetical protein HZH66_001675 [Vespula vulgaris]|uniref:Uncharacterized protein n=1 Tax=Vespula vulgaris TaxID=7454 RepID=A0A834KIC9_VESVU|nr:hypothetical protein HZH66_001675 [Vespula vulgaris]